MGCDYRGCCPGKEWDSDLDRFQCQLLFLAVTIPEQQSYFERGIEHGVREGYCLFFVGLQAVFASCWMLHATIDWLAWPILLHFICYRIGTRQREEKFCRKSIGRQRVYIRKRGCGGKDISTGGVARRMYPEQGAAVCRSCCGPASRSSYVRYIFC